jgi:hypothetical protein
MGAGVFLVCICAYVCVLMLLYVCIVYVYMCVGVCFLCVHFFLFFFPLPLTPLPLTPLPHERRFSVSCVYMCVVVYMCVYLCVYLCICLYMCVYVCICMYTCVYVCICVFVYKPVDDESAATWEQPVMRRLSRDEQTTGNLDFLCVGGIRNWSVLAHIVRELRPARAQHGAPLGCGDQLHV